jgi:hypothetical protein
LKKYNCTLSLDLCDIVPETFSAEELLLVAKSNLHGDDYGYPKINNEDDLLRDWGYRSKDKLIILLTRKEYRWLLDNRYKQAVEKKLNED